VAKERRSAGESKPPSETIADYLFVGTGDIVVTDAGQFFGGKEPCLHLRVPTGWHRVSLTYAPVPESLVTRVGVYSDEELPEVLLRVTEVERAPAGLVNKPYERFERFVIEQMHSGLAVSAMPKYGVQMATPRL
jgi:hypothetical protein